MVLGVFLKACNNTFFGNYLDFFFEFIPQIFFLFATFGYMVILIFIKWSTDYRKDTSEAPSILNIFINFGLKGGQAGDDVLYGEKGYQDTV